jgi:hypothetical protein
MPIQVPKTPSTSHPLAQRNAFHRRDVRQQFELLAGEDSMRDTQAAF